MKLRVCSWKRFLEAIGNSFEIMNTLRKLLWSILVDDVQLKYDYMNRIGRLFYDEHDWMLWICWMWDHGKCMMMQIEGDSLVCLY